MKKIALVSAVAALLVSGSALADVTASATASWDATATKDTTSSLVVTPLKSVAFQYAEGLQAFNSQKGAFDVTIKGQDGATDFTLTSRLVSSTLTSTTNASTLNVGVFWNGTELTTAKDVTMVNTASGIEVNSGLESLSAESAYKGATGVDTRTSAQSAFDFTINSATVDGSTATQDYTQLADGYWSGDVRVQFTAVWTTA